MPARTPKVTMALFGREVRLLAAKAARNDMPPAHTARRAQVPETRKAERVPSSPHPPRFQPLDLQQTDKDDAAPNRPDRVAEPRTPRTG